MTCQVLVVRQNEAHHVHGFQMVHDLQSDFGRDSEKWKQSRNPGSGLDVLDANSRKSRRQPTGLQEGIVCKGKIDESFWWKQVDDIQDELSRQQVERMLWPYLLQHLIAVFCFRGWSFWMGVVRGHVVVFEWYLRMWRILAIRSSISRSLFVRFFGSVWSYEFPDRARDDPGNESKCNDVRCRRAQ